MSEMTFQANEVVSCVDEEEDGAMLYNPDEDESVMLNPSGRTVWTFLAEPRTLDEVAGHLTSTYPGVAAAQAKQDAQAFITSLMPIFILSSEKP